MENWHLDLATFQRQYLQLVELKDLSWPSKKALRAADCQAWLYSNLFDDGRQPYLPPDRYRRRVLKQLMQLIESAIKDPEEDEISDNLSSCLATLMSKNLPPESVAVLKPSYVTYSFDRGDDPVASVTTLESRNLLASAGTTGMRTWETALHFGKFLTHASSTKIQGKRVLELGAGMGVISIFCARWLGAEHVTITDGDDAVIEALQSNLFLNRLTDTDRVKVKSLKWGQTMEEDEGGELPRYDVVLGTDITYDPRPLPALIATFRELFILNPALEVLIGTVMRREDTFDAFATACKRSKLAIVEVDFPVTPARAQVGPFYSTDAHYRIVQIKPTEVIRDPLG